MRVAVIGCGPAGLAAAHAATGLGCEVVVLAPKGKTPQRGPLLIQRPIPGINTDHPDGTIHQLVIDGSIVQYRMRLYGDVNININGDILAPSYHAWNHQETYDRLWSLYHDLIIGTFLSPEDMTDIHTKFDFVVSTANALSLCSRPLNHRFRTFTVHVKNVSSFPDQPSDTIIFNAGNRYDWSRSSVIFGNRVTEWRPDLAPEGCVKIEKPLSTDCDCYPEVLRTGRFGAWKNETWVDTAYWDTYTAIQGMGRLSELSHIR